MTRARSNAIEAFGRAFTLGIEMAVAVLLPVFIGQWLDKKTGNDPWFTVGGMILGGAAAIRSAYRALTESLRSQKDRAKPSDEKPEDEENKPAQ
ncbi:MAG: AtpZ/AtpI family protein [Candidatus Lindowbacteria bacterium]|nr:AtpZ/AtpI family protein [Candidatus Lindowbacteria bacterium]